MCIRDRLFGGAKVRAIMEGRYNVSFEDIQTMAYPILRHRIAINFDGITDGVTEEDLIKMCIRDRGY